MALSPWKDGKDVRLLPNRQLRELAAGESAMNSLAPAAPEGSLLLQRSDNWLCQAVGTLSPPSREYIFQKVPSTDGRLSCFCLQSLLLRI